MARLSDTNDGKKISYDIKDYLKKLTIADISLHKGKLVSIGTVKRAKLTVEYLRIFFTANKLKSKSKRDKESYLSILEAERRNFDQKKDIILPKSTGTRHSFALSDDTLYRVMYIYMDKSVRSDVS